MSNKPNPTYFAIITAEVRYDNELKAAEKLLYAEITALTNAQGYCFATNSYFAKLYDVHKNTVGKWINKLCKKGYLKSQIIYDGKLIKERRLYINNLGVTPINPNGGTPSQGLIPINQKVDTPINEMIDTPINQKVEDNNTSTNNTSINSSSTSSSVTKYYEKLIGRLISPREIEVLNSYIEDGLSEEIIKYAIDEALESNVRNMKYIKAILNRCLENGQTKLHHLKNIKKEGDNDGIYDFSTRKKDTKSDISEKRYETEEVGF